jgi:hypothetical protein
MDKADPGGFCCSGVGTQSESGSNLGNQREH